jgi:hypothetical protein
MSSTVKSRFIAATARMASRRCQGRDRSGRAGRGLVEVDVGVDEAGQHQPAAGVDLGRLAASRGLDRGDPAAGYPDIDRYCRRPRPGIAKIRSKAVRALMG